MRLLRDLAPLSLARTAFAALALAAGVSTPAHATPVPFIVDDIVVEFSWDSWVQDQVEITSGPSAAMYEALSPIEILPDGSFTTGGGLVDEFPSFGLQATLDPVALGNFCLGQRIDGVCLDVFDTSIPGQTLAGWDGATAFAPLSFSFEITNPLGGLGSFVNPLLTLDFSVIFDGTFDRVEIPTWTFSLDPFIGANAFGPGDSLLAVFYLFEDESGCVTDGSNCTFLGNTDGSGDGMWLSAAVPDRVIDTIGTDGGGGTPVPEPAPFALLLLAIAALAVSARLRRSRIA